MAKISRASWSGMECFPKMWVGIWRIHLVEHVLVLDEYCIHGHFSFGSKIRKCWQLPPVNPHHWALQIRKCWQLPPVNPHRWALRELFMTSCVGCCHLYWLSRQPSTSFPILRLKRVYSYGLTLGFEGEPPPSLNPGPHCVSRIDNS